MKVDHRGRKAGVAQQATDRQNDQCYHSIMLAHLKCASRFNRYKRYHRTGELESWGVHAPLSLDSLQLRVRRRRATAQLRERH